MLPIPSPSTSTASADSAPDVSQANVDEKIDACISTPKARSQGLKQNEDSSSGFKQNDEKMSYSEKRERKRLQQLEKRSKVDRKLKLEVTVKPAKVEQKSQDGHISKEVILLPCCKVIEQPNKLFSHMKNHHEKDATQCMFCEKPLSSKSSLDRHLLSHSDFKPYICSQCGKVFSTNGNMHRHKKTHIGKNGTEKPKSRALTSRTKKSTSAPQKSKITSKGQAMSALKNKRKSNPQVGNPFKKAKTGDLNDCDVRSDKSYASEASNDVQVPKIKTDIDSVFEKREAPFRATSLPSKQEFINNLGLQNVQRTMQVENGATKESSNKMVSSKQIFSSKELPHSMVEIKTEAMITAHGNSPICAMNESNDFADISSILMRLDVEAHSTAESSKQSPQSTQRLDTDSNTNDCNTVQHPESSDTNIQQVSVFENVLSECAANDSVDKGHQYTCDICYKSFDDSYILKKHKIKHSKPMTFKCSKCSATFPNKPNALKHVQSVHRIPKALAKEHITFNSDNQDSTGTESVCEWCGINFGTSVQLGHHKRASMGCRGKPFICLICNKSFSTKNNGKRHQKQNHPEEKTKNFIIPNIPTENHEEDTTTTSSTSVDSDSFGDSCDSGNIHRTDSCDSGNIQRSDSCDSDNIQMTESSFDLDNSDEPLVVDMGDPIEKTNDMENQASSSNCSDIDMQSEEELSLKKKEELEAAHSLIDMSKQGSSHMGNESIVYQHSPVNLINFNDTRNSPQIEQKVAIDLSIRPMDLTAKHEDKWQRSSPHHQPRFLPTVSHPSIQSLSSISHASNCADIISEVPLNLIKKESPTFDHSINILSHLNAGSHTKSTSSSFDHGSSFHSQHNSDSHNMSTSFTFDHGTNFHSHHNAYSHNIFISSTMDHDINFHSPLNTDSHMSSSSTFDHGTDFHFHHISDSRNMSTSSEASTPVTTSTPLKDKETPVEDSKSTSVQCNICLLSFANSSNKRRHEKNIHQLHNSEASNSFQPLINFKSETVTPKSLLSKKTKEALLTKVCSRPISNAINKAADENSQLASPHMQNTESESGDLASVSSLISTANSTQLKKYLTTDTPNPVSTTSDANTAGSLKPNEQKLGTKKSADKHQCSVCQKKFTCKSSFSRHFVTHTKERPFKCHRCDQTFTVKSNKDRHVKRKHNEKPLSSKRHTSRKTQRKSNTDGPSATNLLQVDMKDTTLPLQPESKEISQCNKENQLYRLT